MRGIFVAGTGTGVGKTLFSAGLAGLLRRRGIDVGVMKPFATADKVFSRKYRSADVAMLARAARVEEKDSEINPSFYAAAASPLMAAELTNSPESDLDEILKRLKQLGSKHDFLIVEGIGGVQVPLNSKSFVLDFMQATGLPAVIVSVPFLGTLNHTLMTANACKSAGIRVAGIIVNMMPRKPTPVERMTPKYLARLSGFPVLGTLSRLSRPSYASAGRLIERTVDVSRLLSMQ